MNETSKPTTVRVDFNNIQRCCICGRPLSEDEVYEDEYDRPWCGDCIEEFAARVDDLTDKMKMERGR